MSTTTTVPVQIRIDKETREQANELFKDLGTDMSGAVNIFLKQCVLTDSIPLKIKKPRYNEETEEAIDEARRISRDPNAESYHTFEEYQTAMRRLIDEDE